MSDPTKAVQKVYAASLLAQHVHEQLPRDLQERLRVRIDGDPYGLRSIAVFTPVGPDGRVTGRDPIKAEIATTVVEGKMVFAKIPDEVLSLLCVSV